MRRRHLHSELAPLSSGAFLLGKQGLPGFLKSITHSVKFYRLRSDAGKKGWVAGEPTMPQLGFRDGYIDAWRWINGEFEVGTVPPHRVPECETSYRAGVLKGVRDACASRLAEKRRFNFEDGL